MEEVVQPAASRKRIQLASGVEWERLTARSERGVEFLYVTYEVGGASSGEGAYQRHSGHEWGYVLDGRLDVRIGFEDYILEPGDAISFDSTIPHRLANAGDGAGPRDLVRAGAGAVGGRRRAATRSTTRTSTSRRRRGRPPRADRGRRRERSALRRSRSEARVAAARTCSPNSVSRPCGNRYDGPWTWTAATTSPVASATAPRPTRSPSANSPWTQA